MVWLGFLRLCLGFFLRLCFCGGVVVFCGGVVVFLCLCFYDDMVVLVW